MIIPCQVCNEGIELQKCIDLNDFDGQVVCGCGESYRIKLKNGHLKRYGRMPETSMLRVLVDRIRETMPYKDNESAYNYNGIKGV